MTITIYLMCWYEGEIFYLAKGAKTEITPNRKEARVFSSLVAAREYCAELNAKEEENESGGHWTVVEYAEQEK